MCWVSGRAAVYNMKLLGAIVDAAGKKPKTKARRVRESAFELSRWVPVVKDIVEDALSGNLPLDTFPCQRDTPNIARSEAGADEPVQSARRWVL